MNSKTPIAIDELVDEIRLAFHALGAFATRVGDLDSPSRAVLEFLMRNGPATVPEIARRRGVTRQHIQTIVNGLADDELVVAETNPAHRRSHLIALTPTGTDRISTITARERDLLYPAIEQLDIGTVNASADLLRELRRHLDGVGHEAATNPDPEETS